MLINNWEGTYFDFNEERILAIAGRAKEIGVELTDSFLMLPVKSVSGLMFESEEHYTNCTLCPRAKCPGRRSPFDPQLYRQKYHLGA